MKKILPIIVLCLIAASCQIAGQVAWSTSYVHTSAILADIASDMLSASADYVVSEMNDYVRDSIDVNNDGFEAELVSRLDGSNVDISVVRTAEGQWSVEGSGEKLDFSMILSSDLSGELCEWAVSDYRADYDELNGYTATLVSDGDIEYTWNSSSTSQGYNWTLRANGKCVMETFVNGKTGDSAELTITNGKMDVESYTTVK